MNGLLPRLVLRLVAVAIPLLAAFVLLRWSGERQAAVERMREIVDERVDDDLVAACARNPERFELRTRGFHGHAYGADLQPRNPRAPPFPPPLRDKLRPGDDHAAFFRSASPASAVLAVAMPGASEPCAWLVVARRPPPGVGPQDGPPHGPRGRGVHAPDPILAEPPGPSLARIAPQVAVVALILALSVLVAAGPLVRRVRALTADVRASARDEWRTPVRVDGNDELGRLATSFNDAAREVRARIDALRERERDLVRFIDNTTHDVRTPLTVLHGHLAALRRRARLDDADAARLGDALREVAWISSLLDNLDAAARLDSGTLAPQQVPLDLRDTIERVVARFRPLAELGGVDLNHATPPDPVTVRGDSILLQQAIGNLVQNAIQYHRDGGHVALTLDTDGDQFTVHVVDDGPGVPDDELTGLANGRFRAEESRTRNPSGRGIGLGITADVCRAHGFSLRFSRTDGGGLTATLDGPLAPDPSTPARAGTAG